tara:strand:+ start:8143 stop:8937 length:795 start_codon:yes stop_codon:yes gene_type:complete
MSDENTPFDKAFSEKLEKADPPQDLKVSIIQAMDEAAQEEEAFDKTFSTKVDAIEPPADLKQNILQAIEAISSDNVTNFEQPEKQRDRTQLPWWRKTTVLSMAACAALMLTLAAVTMKPKALEADEEDELPHFLDAAIERTSEESLAFQSNDMESLRGFLIAQDAPRLTTIPKWVQNLEPIGVETFTWQGKQISRVLLGRADKSHFNLFIARRFDFPREHSLRKYLSEQKGDQGLLSWSDNENIYFFIFKGDTPNIKQVLQASE